MIIYVDRIEKENVIANFQPEYMSHDMRSNNVVCMTSKASVQPANTRSLIRAFACGLNDL